MSRSCFCGSTELPSEDVLRVVGGNVHMIALPCAEYHQITVDRMIEPGFVVAEVVRADGVKVQLRERVEA